MIKKLSIPMTAEQTEFTEKEVLDLAAKYQFASFKEVDRCVIKRGGWFWTSTWVQIDGKKGMAWNINTPTKTKEYDNIPTEDGLYLLDELGMPIEKSSMKNKDARYFWRLTKYTGLLCRGRGFVGGGGRRYVYAGLDPTDRFGVLAVRTKPHKHEWKTVSSYKNKFKKVGPSMRKPKPAREQSRPHFRA